MKTKKKLWTKTELQVYILLLCANSDSNETKEELTMIKSKVDEETFNNIYTEFKADNEDKQFEKIGDAIHNHEFSHKELNDLKREMYEIFFSDCNFNMMERNLDKILENILY